MTRLINKSVFFIFLTFAVYSVNIKSIPLDIYRYFYVFSVFYVIFSCNQIKLEKRWLLLLFFLLLSTIYMLFISLYSKSLEITFIRMNIDYIITAILVSPVVCSFYIVNSNEPYKDILQLIIYIVSFQAIIMLCMLISPSIQKVVFDYIGTNGSHVRYEGDYRFRAIGLTGFSSYTMAVCQSFGLYLFHLLWTFKLSIKESIISIVLFFLVLISAILSARTAFIFIIPLFIQYILFLCFSNNRLLKSKLKLILLILFVSLVYLITMSSSFQSDEIIRMQKWIFELFINFNQNGSFNTSSSDSLKSLFFIPKESTILWGDGKYLLSDGQYYMHTDVGYLRVLLYGGVIGSILFYSPFIYVSYLLFKTSSRVFGELLSFSLLIFSSLLFVVNIKGSIFFDGFNTQKMIFIFVYSLIYIEVFFKKTK